MSPNVFELSVPDAGVSIYAYPTTGALVPERPIMLPPAMGAPVMKKIAACAVMSFSVWRPTRSRRS